MGITIQHMSGWVMSNSPIFKFFRGALIIVAAYHLGDVGSMLIGGFLSSSIMGMIFLFIALKIGIVKQEWVKYTADIFLDNIILFYLPPVSGLLIIDYMSLSHQGPAIISASVISTFIVLFVVAKIVEKMEVKTVKIEHKEGRDNA